MRHRPVVTNFRVRPITYPDGHWMNRFWGPIVRAGLAVFVRFPVYRYVLRAHPAAEEVLASGRPAVFACVHQDVFDCFNGLPRLFADRPLCAMVSQSRDGTLAAMALSMLGFDVIRGSSSRGGGEGLLQLRMRISEGSSVLMVSDGPKAPLGDVKPGAVMLAAKANVPILPLRAWGLSRLRLRRSWTRLAVTIPFNPVAFCVGAPIRVPQETPTSGTRPYQIAVAKAIADLARWASVWAGGPPVAPYEVAGG